VRPIARNHAYDVQTSPPTHIWHGMRAQDARTIILNQEVRGPADLHGQWRLTGKRTSASRGSIIPNKLPGKHGTCNDQSAAKSTGVRFS
jgi:hypothetical protein